MKSIPFIDPKVQNRSIRADIGLRYNKCWIALPLPAAHTSRHSKRSTPSSASAGTLLV